MWSKLKCNFLMKVEFSLISSRCLQGKETALLRNTELGMQNAEHRPLEMMKLHVEYGTEQLRDRQRGLRGQGDSRPGAFKAVV